MNQLSADYLVVGSGAMGLAFVDEVLSADSKATVILVDRYGSPGGHWNVAYPHVSLHQPAAFYGVNSEPLGNGGIALASGTEVLTYFQKVIVKHQHSGRLKYFPQCEYSFEETTTHQFQSNVSGQQYEVSKIERLVDATYMQVEVPFMRPAPFPVASEQNIVPPNSLSSLTQAYQKYVIVGAGKTGMDAVLLLLDRGVKQEAIRWIMPNDAWLLDRANIFPEGLLNTLGTQMRLSATAKSLEDLLIALETEGMLLRLDPQVWASKYRCATVSQSELTALRGIKDVVRLGRVEEITADQLRLRKGTLQIEDNSLFVDCTANGLSNRPIQPIFSEGKITLQSVAMCQQVYSASLIAHVQLNFSSDQEKNDLCTVIPHPETIDDYLYAQRMRGVNAVRWGKSIRKWIRKARLSFNSHIPMWRILLKRSELIKYTSASAANLNRIAKQRADIKSSQRSGH
jgi:hypothetical protein